MSLPTGSYDFTAEQRWNTALRYVSPSITWHCTPKSTGSTVVFSIRQSKHCRHLVQAIAVIVVEVIFLCFSLIVTSLRAGIIERFNTHCSRNDSEALSFIYMYAVLFEIDLFRWKMNKKVHINKIKVDIWEWGWISQILNIILWQH